MMKIEIDPKDTSRAAAFELWMKAPNQLIQRSTALWEYTAVSSITRS